MAAVRPVSPRLLNLPHRDPPPRTLCGSCKGGGSINEIHCGDCSGRGWHDASHPQAAGKPATTDGDAY